MQQETREMLGLCGAKSEGDVGVRLATRQYLAADGSVISSQPMPQLMTSWGLLYSWFKKSFPEQNYHFGQEFQNLEQSESSVTLAFQRRDSRLSRSLRLVRTASDPVFARCSCCRFSPKYAFSVGLARSCS